MKRALLIVAVAALASCASAPKPPAETAAATPPAPATTTAAEAPAEKPEAAEPREALDPLSVGGSLEAASVPKVELTPQKELRAKSRGDLEAAMSIVKSESTVDKAVKRVTGRLGKPTWTEDGKRRVWIAKDGKSCTRFVLDADGTVDIESVPASEWRMLSALAQQNACTGEIRRGVPGSQ